MSSSAFNQLPPLVPQGRPGIISAIGICSIIVASIGLIGSLVGGLHTFGVMMVARQSAASARSATAGATMSGAIIPLPTPEQLATQPSIGLNSGTAAETGDASKTMHPSGLSELQVHSVLAQITSTSKKPLNLNQMNAVRDLLRSQKPPIVPPGQAYAAVRLVNVAPDGSATVWLTNGMLIIDSSGLVDQQIRNAVQELTMSPIAVTMLIGENIVSVLLSVMLLVGGILVIRRSPMWPGLHWVYIGIKLPLCVLGISAFQWVMNDVNAGVSRLRTGGNDHDVFTHFWTTCLVIGGIYPVILAIVMLSSTVRGYCSANAMEQM